MRGIVPALRGWFAIVLVAALAACSSTPRDAFRLSESALAIREMQTREYEDVDDGEILSAAAGVLQDLGYAIDEVEKPLGVLSASKRADANSAATEAGFKVLDAATCMATYFIKCGEKFYLKSANDEQDIRLTAVVRPVARGTETYAVRITIQRLIWDRGGRISKRETISDQDVYDSFFQKLSKSVFLEEAGV